MIVTPIPARTSLDHVEVGLGAIRSTQLSPTHQHLLDAVSRHNGGDPAWRVRKLAEARDLLALSQIAPPGRLVVQMLDLRASLRAIVAMRVPVSCRPDEHNVLRVAPGAILLLNYPREVLLKSLPGPSFVQILDPPGVWHANVAAGEQALCLGAVVPSNTPLVQLVVMTYDALAMKTRQVDERHVAGVLNLEAARWWAANLHRTPLAKAWFLEPDDV